jgi:peroxiredoxin Q/BCP
MLKPGDKAPDFSAPDQTGAIHRLKDYRGQKLVLYFYPKDMTSGCTAEACDFRDNLARVQSAGASVLGISPDPVKRHLKFAEKESLNFPLLADPERNIVQAYDVWKEKSMYGRKYMGVERTTFIIDEQGRIEKIFPKVKVPGHVQEVLDALAD